MSNHNTRPPELLPTARERSTSRRGRLPRQPLPLVAVLVALAALTPASAAADDALGSAIGPEARLQPLGLEAPDGSPYAHRGAAELDAIAHALATRAAVPDHDPWGKRVCGVSAVAEPVFREEDLIPRWANLFH
ncbi:MAG: hypothetical protein H6699_07910 [Myxococcales bacterium]|nr:hypothetical protein [Myxococcales bacterium]